MKNELLKHLKFHVFFIFSLFSTIFMKRIYVLIQRRLIYEFRKKNKTITILSKNFGSKTFCSA